MKKTCLILFSILIISAPVFAQKLTKEQLVEKSNALFEGGRQQDAVDLINEYPEFADEPDVLYVKSVAYTELRDYKNADAAYQKSFDNFLKNGEESLKIADEYAAKVSATKDDREMAALMYEAAAVSFGSANLVNALRIVAFDKNGMPEAKREPKNLVGFDDFIKDYERSSLRLAEMNAQNNKFGDAVENYTKAIEINPKSSAAYAGRAKVYRKLKKLRLAIADERNARLYAAKK